MPRAVTIHLEQPLLESAREGRHNFIGLVAEVLRAAGYGIAFAPQGTPFRSDTLALTHMTPPPPGGLTFRRAYHYPFWSIETTAERWNRHVAGQPFQSETVADQPARRTYDRWRKRLFPGLTDAPRREGLIYVPLQGRLLDHRSFQSCAPMEMLSLPLAADPARDVVATLHPKETYSTAELDALHSLAARNPRLTILTGGMGDMLARCDYVVTMNSAAAFNAFFFGKPSILFAKIDFHHICLTASPQDLGAFGRIVSHAPDYALYLWWFWQENCVNAGRPDARERIRETLMRAGWSI